VVADVVSAEQVESVVVLVDGQEAAAMVRPPFRTVVDLGEENAAHILQVVATDVTGARSAAAVETAAIPVGGSFTLSLQQLYVTAMRSGERALDLAREDFQVVDDGARQELIGFERGDIPFTAVLMIDASASMHGRRFGAAKAGVSEFVNAMQPLDEVSLLAFSDRVVGSTPLSNDPAVVEEALSGCEPVGGTAIHDHLYMAVKLLEQRQGRRVVILLSDGIDSLSALDTSAVLRTVRHSQALMYWIWLMEPDSLEFESGRLRDIHSTWHTTEEYRRQLKTLHQTVEESGGRVVRVRAAEEIEQVFADILRELREQYVLGYYPSNNRDDGRWHRVRVKVDQPGVEVRAHAGYVDF
jgi:Ca-activated chloride channel family protein